MDWVKNSLPPAELSQSKVKLVPDRGRSLKWRLVIAIWDAWIAGSLSWSAAISWKFIPSWRAEIGDRERASVTLFSCPDTCRMSVVYSGCSSAGVVDVLTIGQKFWPLLKSKACDLYTLWSFAPWEKESEVSDGKVNGQELFHSLFVEE